MRGWDYIGFEETFQGTEICSTVSCTITSENRNSAWSRRGRPHSCPLLTVQDCSQASRSHKRSKLGLMARICVRSPLLSGLRVGQAVLLTLPLLDSALLLALKGVGAALSLQVQQYSAQWLPTAKVLGWGDGWLVGRTYKVGLQSESRVGENANRTG